MEQLSSKKAPPCTVTITVQYKRGKPGEELGGYKFDRSLIVARGWVRIVVDQSEEKRAKPNPSESIWQTSIKEVMQQRLRFFCCCCTSSFASQRVTKDLSLVVWIPSMTVESKIARSFNAWAQWELRTPYHDPLLFEQPVYQMFWTGTVVQLWPIRN